MALANRQTDRCACLEKFSSSIDKVSFKNNSMSLGLVVLEEKLFTCTPTPQSDDIKTIPGIVYLAISMAFCTEYVISGP